MMAPPKNPPPIQAMADTRWGVSQVYATTARQPMKRAKRPQMAAMAEAKTSAAISRRVRAKSRLARSAYAATCLSSAGAAFGSDHSRRTFSALGTTGGQNPHNRADQSGDTDRLPGAVAHIIVGRVCDALRMLAYGVGSICEALLRRINRALNLGAYPHHIGILQICDPCHQIFDVRDQILDFGRSSRLDVVDAVAQVVLEATPAGTCLLSGSVECRFHYYLLKKHREQSHS